MIGSMRNKSIDIMKGVGIIAVIFGHMTEIPFSPYRNILFSFHMPLFFIISGYFFRLRSIKSAIAKDMDRLIKPYILTCMLLMIWGVGISLIRKEWSPLINSIIASIYGSGSTIRDTFLGNIPAIGAIWFLLALFWCKNLFNIISQYYERYKYLIALIIASVSILLDRYVINLPFAFLPGCSALIFFIIGEGLHQFKYNSKQKYIGLFICILCWVYCMFYSHISMVKSYYEIIPIDILGACGGTYVVYVLSKGIIKLPLISDVLSWIGKNSLALLCFHLIEMNTGVLSLALRLLGITTSIPFIILARFSFVLLLGYVCSFIPLTRRVYGYS